MRVRFGCKGSAEDPVTAFVGTTTINGTGYLDQEIKYFEEIRCAISRIPRASYCSFWCSSFWRGVVVWSENDSRIKQWLASNSQLLFSDFRSFAVPHPYSLQTARNVNWLVHVRAKHLGTFFIPFIAKKTTMYVHYYFFPSIYIFWKRKSSSLRKLMPILSLTPTMPSLRLRPLTKVTAPFNISSWQSGF